MDGVGAAREDDHFGVTFQDAVHTDVSWEHNREDIHLADATADELGVLGPIVQDHDGLVARRVEATLLERVEGGLWVWWVVGGGGRNEVVEWAGA